jgi:hypothetical protein
MKATPGTSWNDIKEATGKTSVSQLKDHYKLHLGPNAEAEQKKVAEKIAKAEKNRAEGLLKKAEEGGKKAAGEGGGGDAEVERKKKGSGAGGGGKNKGKPKWEAQEVCPRFPQQPELYHFQLTRETGEHGEQRHVRQSHETEPSELCEKVREGKMACRGFEALRPYWTTDLPRGGQEDGRAEVSMETEPTAT